MTPNFQRQHYLYWCNVYNLSHGSLEGITGHHHSSSVAKVMKKNVLSKLSFLQKHKAIEIQNLLPVPYVYIKTKLLKV